MPTRLVPTPRANRLLIVACMTCIVVPVSLTIWVFTAAVAAL